MPPIAWSHTTLPRPIISLTSKYTHYSNTPISSILTVHNDRRLRARQIQTRREKQQVNLTCVRKKGTINEPMIFSTSAVQYQLCWVPRWSPSSWCSGYAPIINFKTYSYDICLLKRSVDQHKALSARIEKGPSAKSSTVMVGVLRTKISYSMREHNDVLDYNVRIK